MRRIFDGANWKMFSLKDLWWWGGELTGARRLLQALHQQIGSGPEGGCYIWVV